MQKEADIQEEEEIRNEENHLSEVPITFQLLVLVCEMSCVLATVFCEALMHPQNTTPFFAGINAICGKAKVLQPNKQFMS